MIERVEVSGWQSLRSVDVPLGRFTVIVGPSSCGKSAFIRALRAVASNVRGGAQITRGCKRSAITVRTGDHVITLERSATAGQYRLVDAVSGVEQRYSKLGSSVPEQITQALGISPVVGGSSINFAGQFDAPWLLGESGAVAARVVGELTNITTMFNAVREANRRRAGHAAMLRAREQDLTAVTAQVGAFADLPAQLRACARAEAAMSRVEADLDVVRRLREVVSSLDTAEQVLATTPRRGVVPSLADLFVSQDALSRLTDQIRTLVAADAAVEQATTRVDVAVAATEDRRAELREALDRADVCPVCQRPMA